MSERTIPSECSISAEFDADSATGVQRMLEAGSEQAVQEPPVTYVAENGDQCTVFPDGALQELDSQGFRHWDGDGCLRVALGILP